MKDETNAEILKENLKKIKDSGQYLLGLINDTLDFQKIESGKLVLSKQLVNAKELFDSIAEMIKNTAEQKGVKFNMITKNIQCNWIIQTDPLRLRQVFINLLSNAV